MAIRYTDSKKLGMVFANTVAPSNEDHRKPNIIRGGSKFPRSLIRRPNTYQTTLYNRRGISSSTSSASSAVVVEQNIVTSVENNGHFDSLMPPSEEQLEENDDGSSEDQQQQIYLTDEFHQLIQQPSENHHDAEQYASIQTDSSGNYIMVIRDNEIMSMHSQQPDEDGGDVESSIIVEEEEEECEDVIEEECEEEEDLHGTTECEEVESSNLEDDGDGDEVHEENQEIISAVQSIDPTSESNLFIESEDNSIDNDQHHQVVNYVNSQQSGHEVVNNSEQYVMVQLPDGNSYLIPASSLEGSSMAVDGSTCGEQIFVNENGDHQVIQVLNTSSGLHLQQASSSSVNSTSTKTNSHQRNVTNHSRAGARKRGYTTSNNYQESSRTTQPPPKKRIHMNAASTVTNGHSSISNGNRYLPNSSTYTTTTKTTTTTATTGRKNNNSQHPQQKPLPQSRSKSTASSTSTINQNNNHTNNNNHNSRPKPVEKPRPFRFDMPEDEIVRIDPSTDYLSLVIEQFQKENYLK